MWPRILIEMHSPEDNYYVCNSLEEVHKTALVILKQRVAAGVYDYHEMPVDFEVYLNKGSKTPVNYPQKVRESMYKQWLNEWKTYKRYKEIETIIKNEDGEEAWGSLIRLGSPFFKLVPAKHLG